MIVTNLMSLGMLCKELQVSSVSFLHDQSPRTKFHTLQNVCLKGFQKCVTNYTNCMQSNIIGRSWPWQPTRKNIIKIFSWAAMFWSWLFFFLHESRCFRRAASGASRQSCSPGLAAASNFWRARFAEICWWKMVNNVILEYRWPYLMRKKTSAVLLLASSRQARFAGHKTANH